jgi:hypothetical protein
MTLTVSYHLPFFSQNQIFIRYLYAQFILYTNIKYLNTVTIFNWICIPTGVFFMCEWYTELALLVEIFCTNRAVENKSIRLWLNTCSSSRLAVNALSFSYLNFILYCVVLWTCQVVVVWILQADFVISVTSLWLKTLTEHYGFIIKVYCAYFGEKLRDQDKSWAPHKVCYVCVENLRKWSKGKKKVCRFGVPMI